MRRQQIYCRDADRDNNFHIHVSFTPINDFFLFKATFHTLLLWLHLDQQLIQPLFQYYKALFCSFNIFRLV
jgi:hypothetical protein